MKLNKILWRMRNDFKCEFCENVTTDKHMDSYFLNVVIPSMVCKKCKKSTEEENGN